MSNFVGTWDLDSSENFDEYMSAVGVDLTTRLAVKFIKPTVVISIDGDTWTLGMHSTFKNHETKFKLGEEYDETTADGRKMKSTFTLESPTKLIQQEKGKVDSTIIRELTDDNTLVTISEAAGVTSKRVYKRKA